MKPLILALATLAVAGSLPAVSKKDTVRRSFNVPVSGRALEIDNLFGSISVTAHGGSTIEMVANQRIEADNDAAMQAALQEIRLDISQNGNSVKLYVDGPFRDRSRRNWDPHYRVLYDFEVKVPVETSLRLSTVNEGDIKVSGVTGQFDVHNVNGPIQMTGIGGSGSAITVNGPVTATFRGPAGGPLHFKTINGDLEATFPGPIHADVRAKTMHGDLYTDYEVTVLPNKPVTMETTGRKRRWQGNHGGAVRIGRGGPEFSFETLNGDIRVLHSKP